MTKDEYSKAKFVAYGCWFHIVTGSGIYVNVGKTLIAKSRKQLRYLLNLPPEAGERDFCTYALNLGISHIQSHLIL